MSVSALDSRLSAVLGGKTAEALEKAFGMQSVADLLAHVPRRYATRGQLTALAELPVGENVTIVAEIRQVRERRMQQRRGNIVEAILTDGTGTLSLTFFNQPWRLTELTPGSRGIFAGKISWYQGTRQLAHPDYELFPGELDAAAAEKWATTPIPIYPATAKVPSWKLQKMVAVALDALPEDLSADDALAESTAEWGTYVTALRHVHQPENDEQWRAARDRLKYAEALVLQTALLQAKRDMELLHTTPRIGGALNEQFDARLPFTLTPEQITVGDEIAHDMGRTVPMHRLVQGEVGSGKTVVAIRAMLTAAESGGQSALLAPTEVLAQQHYRSIVQTLGPELAATLHPLLLTGSTPAAERKKALLWLASGQSLIAIGTHALLGEQVSFADLALVVIDEQHRFGVEQRETLRQKAAGAPHTLVLTATPIPRTVAMTTFGDLDVSRITQPPSGRPGIETHVVPLAEKPSWRGRVWERIAEEVGKGRQAFVVAPAIDPSTLEGVEPDEAIAEETEVRPARANVTDLAGELANQPLLAPLRRAVLHGRLPSAEKDAIMNAFAGGEIDVLIATTVIEVGVDVPNASTMVVVDADAFGVSQLHQLRGRVGRGSVPGLCLLVTNAALGSVARERVDAVASTTDGFALAEIDLELRREGDVLGQQQSGGRSSLRLLRVTRDGEVITRARADAEVILAADPELTAHPGLAAALRRRLDEHERSYLRKG
ncbi:MAG: ATP-dependent DNA helicase RecG [Agromyces sp.]